MVLLDTRGICSFADYFIICSGDSERQIEAIIAEISNQLKNDGISFRHSEGTADSGWVLLDIGSIVVHVFSPRQREYYKLDELWSESIPIVRIQ